MTREQNKRTIGNQSKQNRDKIQTSRKVTGTKLQRVTIIDI